MRQVFSRLTIAAAVLAVCAACGGKKPPTTAPPPPNPFPATAPADTTPVSTPRPPDALPVPPDVNPNTRPYDNLSPDDINKQSILKPVFFAYDSDEIDEAGRKTLEGNAQILKDYKGWVLTVEGHCDERGTPEYNLSLGDRRAQAAKNYLLSLGINADRLKTVSYGKEFPFNPGHDESSWTQNRRAQFMVTAK
ncbi:MAG TPA: peptidoglycan-associated lipoprotein Pal [Vicinamibacterales bacterium]